MAQQLATVERAKKAVESVLEIQRSELEKKDAEIAQYRALLGQAGPSSGL
jgi:hypothetical protein